jgi:hypothetical protein
MATLRRRHTLSQSARKRTCARRVCVRVRPNTTHTPARPTTTTTTYRPAPRQDTPRAHAYMRTESKIQLAFAVVGVPLIFYLWKPNAKWPNPFALRGPTTPKPGDAQRS